VEIDGPEKAKPGKTLVVGEDHWFVTECIHAEVAGIEGSLPTAVFPGERVTCIDAIAQGRKYSIEASGHDVHITQSSVIAGDEFDWDE